MESRLRPCVFFDRDGVVNRSPGAGWVERWEEFELLPAFVGALRVARARGYEAVVVTNQSAVARGIMTRQVVEEMHANLRALLRRSHGLDVLDILFCPHLNEGCECRKPRPGMLLEAARRHGLDLAASWMIGDSRRDVEAGRQAGCRTVLVAPDGKPGEADFVAADMGAVPGLLERELPARKRE